MSKGADRDREALEHVRAALAGLRFGEIVIAVHDGEIVQIARTEKIRPNRTDR
ncbi:MAG TPA: YezD family protein [Kofleriaceae bacterium]|nr:YezD family protein [Kofleriaceae bacterium]